METVQTSWLADGVKEIERVVKASMIVEPKVLEVKHEKPGTYAFITPGPAGQPQNVELKVSKPLWHNERLETPRQLMQFIKSLEEDRAQKPATDAAVYVGRDLIRYVYSFEDRRDRVTVPLITSEPWAWLNRPTNPMNQREIIRVLRITFAGCLPPGSGLLDVLRNVKWNNQGQIESNLQRGKEALGRQILNEAAGMDNFPDEFVLNVRVYQNFNHLVQVRCALEVLPDTQKFEIIPFPNQLQDGLEETLLALQSTIEDTGVPTFIGQSNHGTE